MVTLEPGWVSATDWYCMTDNLVWLFNLWYFCSKVILADIQRYVVSHRIAWCNARLCLGSAGSMFSMISQIINKVMKLSVSTTVDLEGCPILPVGHPSRKLKAKKKWIVCASWISVLPCTVSLVFVLLVSVCICQFHDMLCYKMPITFYHVHVEQRRDHWSEEEVTGV